MKKIATDSKIVKYNIELSESESIPFEDIVLTQDEFKELFREKQDVYLGDLTDNRIKIIDRVVIRNGILRTERNLVTFIE